MDGNRVSKEFVLSAYFDSDDDCFVLIILSKQVQNQRINTAV